MSWQDPVLDFWFGLSPEQWWRGGEALDAVCTDRFLDDARTALAAVILFDQLPRNMFRGHANQFMTDPLALAVAKGAVDRGYDEQLSKDERAFLYMPFQHSEQLADQRRSAALFTALGDDFLLGYAKKHLAIIERFARFPHRNAMLGRAPRPSEKGAGNMVPW